MYLCIFFFFLVFLYGFLNTYVHANEIHETGTLVHCVSHRFISINQKKYRSFFTFVI